MVVEKADIQRLHDKSIEFLFSVPLRPVDSRPPTFASSLVELIAVAHLKGSLRQILKFAALDSKTRFHALNEDAIAIRRKHGLHNLLPDKEFLVQACRRFFRRQFHIFLKLGLFAETPKRKLGFLVTLFSRVADMNKHSLINLINIGG